MIHLFYEDCDRFEKTIEQKVLKSVQLIEKEGFKAGDLSVVFCSDQYLLSLNKEYLKHDYFTDIITFSYNDQNTISGDLFISIDRVCENAKLQDVALLKEILRVVIHGQLHLCGYNDKTQEDISVMRLKEREYLEMMGFT